MSEEIRVIEPGKRHEFNGDPHFRPDAVISLSNTNPIVFELRDGRRVKVFPQNKSYVRILDVKGYHDGNYSKFIIDEVAGKKGEFKPVTQNALRNELALALMKDHKLHADRFV